MSDWSSDVCSADLDDRLFACPCRADGVGAARARRPGRPCRRASRARSGLVAAPAFLPDARRNAVPRRRTRRAIPHLRAFLPPVAAADRALLCRPLNDHGQAAPARGQASRRDRPCDFVAGQVRLAMIRRAIVIGAGFGGLALAIRLQSAGIATTIVEARDEPGGRAYHWKRDGFTFDAGPTVITDPPCLEELWALSGQKMAEDVDLVPVMPFYRLNWPDGTNFDYSNDEAALRDEIAKLCPGDVDGYDRFLTYSRGVYEQGYVKLGAVAFLDFASMIKAAPALMKYRAWRSVYGVVSSYVRDERLRQALSFHTLLVGGNPMTTRSEEH